MDRVLQFCFMLERRKEGLERAMEGIKDEQKRQLKEYGHVTTDSIRRMENYKKHLIKIEAIHFCLMHALKKDQPFLDMIRI